MSSSLKIADYKNDYSDVAAEKLLRKCSCNWKAYQYLQDREHDAWLPDSARQPRFNVLRRHLIVLCLFDGGPSADSCLVVINLLARGR